MSDVSAVETIRLLAYAVKKQLADQLELEAIGLVPMQVRVMKIIHRRSPCTALDIASVMRRDKAQVTRLINGLLDKGLVQKAPNPEDRRSQYLLLTQEGRVVQEGLSTLARRAEQAMTKGIEEADMLTFFSVAKDMIQNLEDGE